MGVPHLPFAIAVRNGSIGWRAVVHRAVLDGEVAPIPDLPALAPEQEVRPKAAVSPQAGSAVP